MVDLALLQSVSYIAGALGVCVAAVYYVINLRYNMNAREMEISRLHTSEITSNPGMTRYAYVMSYEWKDYEDFMKKYMYSNPEAFGNIISQLFTFETLGVLLKSGVVDAGKLYALGGYGAIRVWDKYRDVIQGRRGTAWGHDYMSNAEYFAGEMLKIKMINDASFKDKLETYRKTGKL